MNDPKNPSNNFQDVCISCGMCCDGTLFKHATVKPGEENGNFTFKSNPKTGKRYFELPCQYHLGKCTLDLDKRAHVCSAFKCRLLRQLHRGKLTQQEAMEKVNRAMKMKSQLERSLNALVPDAEGSINDKFQNFQKSYSQDLGEKEFRRKHGKLLVEYQLFKEFLKQHFRTKKEVKEMSNG